MDPVAGQPRGLPGPVVAATVVTAIQGGLAVLLGLVLIGRGQRIRRLDIGVTGARLRGVVVIALLLTPSAGGAFGTAGAVGGHPPGGG